jgi:hypothetical protein
MTSATSEQLVAALEKRRAIGEQLASLAQAPTSDAPPHDAETELAEERPALGEAVDAEAVVQRVDEAQLEVLVVVHGVHARDDIHRVAGWKGASAEAEEIQPRRGP